MALSSADVETIVGQAVAEADALGVAGTIAVVDHVGNVLAVYSIPGADPNVTVRSGKRVGGTPVREGLDGAPVKSSHAAISKAGTAAYLSTQGNAFTSRTANHIVLEHFNPGERGKPGGPLFGVQFSQLPCGDLVLRAGVDGQRGPKRMPLGFSADPGGIPLYLAGVPVGAVGVEFGGDGPSAEQKYGGDANIADFDRQREERIAVAASRGFQAPIDRRADRISVDGKFLRFADDQRRRTSAAVPLDPTNLEEVRGFYDPNDGFKEGVQFRTPASGIRPTVFEGLDVEILVDAEDMNRFPPIDALTSPGLTMAEVTSILREAMKVANAARAQIRRPLPSPARVNVSVVGLDGEILGFIRSPDAPIFGIDVSLQKARAAAFLSGPSAATDLTSAGFGSYVNDVRSFLRDPGALTGTLAFSNRAIGNLARPFFPDGIDGNRNGPFSRPFPVWSPFNTGIQLDLVAERVLSALDALDDPNNPAILSCTHDDLSEIKNGIQIFPGSVPIYRGNDLVGGIGISGDGVDQDDLIAFLGLHKAGGATGTVGNAPLGIRADRIAIGGVVLRYVNCPPTPFIGSRVQNVCSKK